MEGLVDDRTRAEATRPFRSLEEDNDKDVKRQRLRKKLHRKTTTDVETTEPE